MPKLFLIIYLAGRQEGREREEVFANSQKLKKKFVEQERRLLFLLLFVFSQWLSACFSSVIV